MLLGDSDGCKYQPFIIFKSNPAKRADTQLQNNSERNGFGVTVWKEVLPLQDIHRCKIYGNRTAWWNSKLSIEFLRYHFASRENVHENVLLLWDDFSGHWTDEVVDYATSINVVLLKVPPRYTYVCQPADISWNEPLKSRLRARWMKLLEIQLRSFKAQEAITRKKRNDLVEKVRKTHLTHYQGEARAAIEEMRSQFDDKPFKLNAPGRTTITEWTTECWYELTATTISSGFRKVGLLMDTRVVEGDDTHSCDTESTVEKLLRLKLVEATIDSDDDIEASDNSCDSE
ncbi:hypothetical protein DVH05_004246 [Phytophthora capsici]|nr:hypothetical protein DVH05_004246 [Phytophthora capsici]